MSDRELLAALSASFGRIISGLQATERSQGDAVLEAAGLLVDAALNRNLILVCGNGGSAADAQHFAGELMSSFQHGLDRRSLPAIALGSNSSTVTAYANDFGFENVFARQIEGLGHPGDCLLAISTSGRSVNVIRAAETALDMGMSVIALVGTHSTRLSEIATVTIHAQGDDTQTIQAIHLALEHLLCLAIDEAVYNTDVGR